MVRTLVEDDPGDCDPDLIWDVIKPLGIEAPDVHLVHKVCSAVWFARNEYGNHQRRLGKDPGIRKKLWKVGEACDILAQAIRNLSVMDPDILEDRPFFIAGGPPNLASVEDLEEWAWWLTGGSLGQQQEPKDRRLHHRPFIEPRDGKPVMAGRRILVEEMLRCYFSIASGWDFEPNRNQAARMIQPILVAEGDGVSAPALRVFIIHHFQDWFDGKPPWISGCVE
jgi:hypothetical protein